jgi:lysophospholipase L1-like esterase
MTGIFLAAVLSIGIVLAGVVGAELYARTLQGNFLWTWDLQRSYAAPLDQMKIWNRQFYEQRRGDFRGWPYPLVFFDADTPTPRYVFKPNVRVVWRRDRFIPARPGETPYWSSNSWGFRNPEFAVKKPSGVIRIVALGSSTTEGSQADNETYPYYLQRDFDRMFPGKKIEVINAGHHGQDIDDELAMLTRYVLPLHPDVVVFYEGAANNNTIWGLGVHLGCTLGWPFGNCWLRSYPSWWRWAYLHSALFVLLTEKLGWSTRPLPPMPHESLQRLLADGKSAAHYQDVLVRIGRETLSHGSTFVAVSMVTVARDSLSRNDPRMKMYYPLTSSDFARNFASFNDRSRATAAQLRVPFFDMASAFPSEPKAGEYFPFDPVHFSPLGNQIFARLVSDFLARSVLRGVMPQPPVGRVQGPRTSPSRRAGH